MKDVLKDLDVFEEEMGVLLDDLSKVDVSISNFKDRCGEVADEINNLGDTLALFSGEDGLDAIKVVATVAMRLLAPGGILATEHDDSHQPGVVEILRAAGLDRVEPHADLTGRPRFVTAVRP